MPKSVVGRKLPELDVLLTDVVLGGVVGTAVGTSVAISFGVAVGEGVGVTVGVWVGVGVTALPARGCAPRGAGPVRLAALTAEARTKSMPSARQNASRPESNDRRWMRKGCCMTGPSLRYVVPVPSPSWSEVDTGLVCCPWPTSASQIACGCPRTQTLQGSLRLRIGRIQPHGCLTFA